MPRSSLEVRRVQGARYRAKHKLKLLVKSRAYYAANKERKAAYKQTFRYRMRKSELYHARKQEAAACHVQ